MEKTLPQVFQAYSLIEKAGIENDPQSALALLLRDCITYTGATTGRLYLLDLAHAAYLQFDAGSKQNALPIISLIGTSSATDDPMLLTAIQNLSILRVEQLQQQPFGRSGGAPAQARLIVPIVRDQVCLGVFDLDSETPHHFTEEHEFAVRIAALVAMLVREKDGVLNLLRELQQPVDYHQGFSEFLDELMLLIATAAKMPLIALRELRDDTLHCLKEYGFADRTEEQLHLSPLSEYPCFAGVIQSRSIFVARRKDNAAVQHFLRTLDLPNVESFIIVPVLVGQDVFGTLSFALLCDHDYTTLEQQGLQTIANAAGVAISNYRNFHLAEERLFSQAQIGAAITTVDVAQSARHEARNHLQHAQETLTLLAGKSAGLSSKVGEEVRSIIDRMSEQLQSVEGALQKIKTITKPPDREKRLVRVDDLWRDAFGLTVGRLAQQQINWNVKGTALVRVAPDYIHTAFLNLILNSIDAFRTAKKKGRTIEVTIEPPSERAADVVMRYTDNASGIDVSKLGPTPQETPRLANDIFLPGVTSKADGSGYGLYLVRKILTDHHGSISLVDHRNGIVFQVKLPQAVLTADERK